MWNTEWDTNGDDKYTDVNTTDDWIDVNKDLPEEGEIVLMTRKFKSPLGENYFTAAKLATYLGGNFISGESDVRILNRLTHWLPFTRLPKI